MKIKLLLLLFCGLQLGCARIVYNIDLKNNSGRDLVALDMNDDEVKTIKNGDRKRIPIPGDWVLRLNVNTNTYFYNFYDVPQEYFQPQAIGLFLEAELNESLHIEYGKEVLLPENEA